MRIKYASATGSQYGQFVVYADNEEERAILKTFLSAPKNKYKFWLHGYGGRMGMTYEHFNFGWGNVIPQWEYYKKGKLRIALAYMFTYCSEFFLKLARKV